MSREATLLRGLPATARVIEVGPSFAPLAPKSGGWNSFVIDHAPRHVLIEKYRDQAVDRIEEVDFVWTGGSLADAVPAEQHGTFDAFIASHVIEHTTDIVTFLQAAQTLLRPDGVVILAVPDKRKCFDFFRHPSATADAVAAFVERRDRHTARTHIDYALGMALKSDEGAWAGDDTRPAVSVCTLADEPHWRATAQRPDYTDAHAWVFVPASFSLMVLELSLLGYLDLRLEDLQEAHATEFYAWLRKGRPALTAEDARRRRCELMERVVVELAEQSRQIAGSPLSGSIPEPDVRGLIAEAENRAQALEAVLAAVRASLGRRGLDRRRFQALIAQASRTVPETGPASVQHRVLLAEARRMLGA